MLTFEMGFKNIFVFTALLLAWKVCKVYGQAARVEYITQPCSSSAATTIKATPQLVVPAIIKPVLSPYDNYLQDSVPCVPNYNGFNSYSSYAPCYPQPMPPIIIDDDNDDNHLLYFLIFAMKNKRNCCSGNCGGYNGGCGCGGGCKCCGCCGCKCCGCCGCNCCSGCGCNCCGGCECNCCGCCGCNCGNYIPYPIPYPINSYGGIEEPYSPNNEINLIIKTDGSYTS